MSLGKVARIFCSTALALSACGPTAWETARHRDTPDAYRSFREQNPGAPQSEEALRREAELRYAGLGEDAKVAELRAFIEDFPDAAQVPEARGRVQSLRLGSLLRRADAAGLERFASQSDDAAMQARARSGAAYLQGARDPLQAGHFEAYLKAHPKGDYHQDAREALAWLTRLRSARPRSKVRAALRGEFPELVPQGIYKHFRGAKMKARYSQRLHRKRLKSGELAYRFHWLRRGQGFALPLPGGRERSYTARADSVAAEIVVKRGGRLQTLWSSPDISVGLPDRFAFPTLGWDSTAVQFARRPLPAPGVDLDRIGKYLAVALRDRVLFLDTSLPRWPRRVARYPAKAGARLFPGRDVVDLDPRIAVQGARIALLGYGVGLIDARKLDAPVLRAHPAARQRVRSGAFVGRHFYFSTETAFFVAGADGKAQQLSLPAAWAVAARDKALLVARADGITEHPKRRGGALGKAQPLPWRDRKGREISVAPVVASAAHQDAVYFIHADGRVSQWEGSELRLDALPFSRVGPVRGLDSWGERLVAASAFGVAVVSQHKKRWRQVHIVPMAGGCQDVEVEGDVAWALCGRALVALHIAALSDISSR